MSQRPTTTLETASEYETSLKTTSRILDLGWLLISLFVAISLVYLSGAQYRQVIFYALGAPTTFFATAWIKSESLSQFRLLPVIGYCLWLPVLVDEKVSSPWISIGLIAATGVVASIAIKNLALAFLVVFSITGIQLYVANMRLTGVSDTNDTLLLNGYFSTLWTISLGLATLLLVRHYFAYAQRIDSAFEAISRDFWERSHAISKINLKDYLNLKLHGTLLNTLIVAQKMPGVASQNEIFRQLDEDIRNLEIDENQVSEKLQIEPIIRERIDFGRLNVEILRSDDVSLFSNSLNLVTELIREIALNLNKHTNSEKITITFFNETENRIKITIREELLNINSDFQLNQLAQAALGSKSLKRLCKESNAEYAVNSYSSGSLLHIFSIHIVDTDLDLLSRAKRIRSESLAFFVKNLSLISTVFAFFAIPGFIYLGLSKLVVLILLVTVVLHILLLRDPGQNVFIKSAAALLPLFIFPITFIGAPECSNLTSLPWTINSFLGAILYGAYSSNNVVSRWLPGILMVLCGAIATVVLPNECKSLLNGTTPGILLVLVLARYLVIFRNRNFQLDTLLDSQINAQSISREQVWRKVVTARDRVISRVKVFVESNRRNPLFDTELTRLINFLRSYLLCSEKFDSDFYTDLFDWISNRYDSGFDTSLELYEFEENALASLLDFQEIRHKLDFYSDVTNLHILIHSGEKLEIEFVIKDSPTGKSLSGTSEIYPNVHLSLRYE